MDRITSAAKPSKRPTKMASARRLPTPNSTVCSKRLGGAYSGQRPAAASSGEMRGFNVATTTSTERADCSPKREPGSRRGSPNALLPTDLIRAEEQGVEEDRTS